MAFHIKALAYVVLFGLFTLFLGQCTHTNQDIGNTDKNGNLPNQNELLSVTTATAPTIDGAIDAIWSNATAIEFTTKVPDPGNNKFQGYVGDTYHVSMKSMYDANSIYFLIEWADKTNSDDRQTWYFDKSLRRWKQESNFPTFNANNVKVRDAFYEDKFAFLWNINNSVPNFSCYSSCHVSETQANLYARHYTNSPTEFMDMWHWKLVRTNINNQLDDSYQNNVQPNGRQTDDKASGGYSDNVQKLTITGTAIEVSVPKYFIPTREYYSYILQSEIDNSTAKLITAVDSNGVLTYSSGTIDPNTEVKFQRDGIRVGPFGMPSIYTSPFVGSRADVIAKGVYTGSGWVLEIKRLLKTTDIKNQDVDFSSKADQPFGVGVFDNSALGHAIKTGLVLKFK